MGELVYHKIEEKELEIQTINQYVAGELAYR